jgi:hypothetical protein
MALPKQVQKQVDELEELEKQLSAPKESPKAKKDEPSPEVAEENQEETEVEVADSENESEVEEPEVAAPADEAKKEDPKDDFKQKYSTLKGKYDAEVPRLHQQVKELADKLAALTVQHEKAEKAKAEKPKERVSLVTDAEKEEFGEELIDVQRRVAREVAQEYEEKLEAQGRVIEDLKAALQNTGNKIGQMGFAQQLAQLVPDFQQIDNDERWVAWLNEYDPMIRGPRRDQAQIAFNNGDAEAVAHYVKLFRQSIAADEPKRDNRQAELEKQVSPTRSVSTQRTDRGNKKVYSEREITNSWNKIRSLNTKGQFDEASKLEAEITSAYLEGRVRA